VKFLVALGLGLLAGAAPPASAAPAEARTVPGLGIALVRIAPGSFVMGSPADEVGHRPNEGPQTRVALTRGFWLGRFELTQGQWRQLMGTTVVEQARRALLDDTPILIGGRRKKPVRDFFGLQKSDDVMHLVGNVDDDLPIIWVSWNEAMDFCRQLTEREGKAGRLPPGYEYRLPTEAEWEYAARAGTTGATYAGPIASPAYVDAPALDPIAWYAGNSAADYQGHAIDTAEWPDQKAGLPGRAGPRKVGQKRPNAWGLYDMLGNAAEWCLDWNGPLPGGSVTDWRGPASGTAHVRRGGGWSSFAPHSRVAFRQWHEPGYRFINLGFRIALAPRLGP